MADSGKAKTPRPGQRADLTIDRVDSKGRGQAQLEGYTVSMRGGVPGDRVLVGLRKVRHRRREAEARILDVVAPGVRRQAAVCEHFGTCGGCALQHVEDVSGKTWPIRISWP